MILHKKYIFNTLTTTIATTTTTTTTTPTTPATYLPCDGFNNLGVVVEGAFFEQAPAGGKKARNAYVGVLC